jgi:hypothetical protein
VTSVTADLLNEIGITDSYEADRTAATGRQRIAKALGVQAMAKTLQRAGRFWRTNKERLLTTAGTTIMMAGLAAAAIGSALTLETTANNVTNGLQAAVTHETLQPVPHGMHDIGLGGSGFALVIAGGGAAATGMRGKHRAGSRENTGFGSILDPSWEYRQPVIIGTTIVDDRSTPMSTFDGMFNAPCAPTVWERMDTAYAAAAERMPIPEEPRYDAFATGAVAGALDINEIAGLTTA